MGGVELLSEKEKLQLQKELKLQKKFYWTVYECTTTIDSINKWKKELETGEKLLRDIIDLDLL